MTDLYILVPSPALCKRIPEGTFEDSIFVLDFQYVSATWKVKRREEVLPSNQTIPAPTFDEIMRALSCLQFYHNITCECSGDKFRAYCYERSYSEELHEARAENAATAALKLWLEINNEVTNEA